jgi:hypothetical protein
MTRTIRVVVTAAAASLCSMGAAAQNAILYGLVDASASSDCQQDGQARDEQDSSKRSHNIIVCPAVALIFNGHV